MSRVLPWAISLALFLTTTVAQSGDTMTEVENNVLNTVKNMTQAFEAGNIDAVMSSYEEKASIAFEPKSTVSDQEQIREMFNAMSAIKPVFEYAGHDVIVNGDLAVHIAPWSMKGVSPDGQVISQSGLSVSVLRKQADGSWKLVIDNPHGASLLNAE